MLWVLAVPLELPEEGLAPWASSEPGRAPSLGLQQKTEGSGLHGVLTLHLTLRLRVKGSGVVQGGPRVGRGGWVVRADPHGRAPQLLQFTEPLGKGQTPGLGLII